jgi:chromosome segregation ATPase
LVNRKRRESEISNKDVDTIKKQNLSLQHTVKNLETEVYQAQELGQQARREKEQLQTQVGYLERQLEQTRESMLQKGKELTDRIRELDLIKDKYQQQGVTVVS